MPPIYAQTRVPAFDERICRLAILGAAASGRAELRVVRTGSLRTKLYLEDGREQITGYYIGGDTVGLDGIVDKRYASEAVALEDGEVCAVPFERLEGLAAASVALQQNIRNVLAREIDRVRRHAMVLRGMTAEQRVANFLLDLSERYLRLGHAAEAFVLQLSRAEIGSHLGVKSETVCRILANMHSRGAIHVHRRRVSVRDASLLSEMCTKR